MWWEVVGDVTAFVGGIRALVVQTVPEVEAAVAARPPAPSRCRASDTGPLDHPDQPNHGPRGCRADNQRCHRGTNAVLGNSATSPAMASQIVAATPAGSKPTGILGA